MGTAKVDSRVNATQRQRGLRRRDSKGAPGPGVLSADGNPEGARASAPPLGNAELVQLQLRVIALENVVIALLAQATAAQLERVRDMAVYISPRPGFTPHPLTVGAAGEMLSLVDRSRHFGPTEDGASD